MNYRQMQHLTYMQARYFQQIQSLFSLFSLIRIGQPLPYMGGYWAIEPDFATIMVALIREHKPRLILEVGSGVSTLVAAYALKDLGQGRIISLEHEQRYLAVSRKQLERHGLEDIASISYAPLTEITIRGRTWLWYETMSIEKRVIDMLIIDGPPARVQSLARYPALPLLFDSLSDKAVVLLDDASRRDEQQIMGLWMKEFSCFKLETVDTMRGTAILHKTGEFGGSDRA